MKAVFLHIFIPLHFDFSEYGELFLGRVQKLNQLFSRMGGGTPIRENNFGPKWILGSKNFGLGKIWVQNKKNESKKMFGQNFFWSK